jgi:hypothetical protein
MRDRRGTRRGIVRDRIVAALALLPWGAASAADSLPPQAAAFDPLDLIFLGIPGYVLLQVLLPLLTSGGWRRAALAPAVIMVPVVVFTALAYAAQSNLWPMALLLTAPFACLYLAVLGVILALIRAGFARSWV